VSWGFWFGGQFIIRAIVHAQAGMDTDQSKADPIAQKAMLTNEMQVIHRIGFRPIKKIRLYASFNMAFRIKPRIKTDPMVKIISIYSLFF
jgi:hypothetical protein